MFPSSGSRTGLDVGLQSAGSFVAECGRCGIQHRGARRGDVIVTLDTALAMLVCHTHTPGYPAGLERRPIHSTHTGSDKTPVIFSLSILVRL